MNDYADSVHVCQCIQLAASAILDDVTANPDLLNVPAYRELIERVYMAACQAACLARILGDDQTANFTFNICERLIQAAKAK